MAATDLLTALMDAVTFDDGSYIDFSCPAQVGDYSTRLFEVGAADGTVVHLEMDRQAMLELHAALTATLLSGEGMQ
jgi:hypothetical protein